MTKKNLVIQVRSIVWLSLALFGIFMSVLFARQLVYDWSKKEIREQNRLFYRYVDEIDASPWGFHVYFPDEYRRIGEYAPASLWPAYWFYDFGYDFIGHFNGVVYGFYPQTKAVYRYHNTEQEKLDIDARRYWLPYDGYEYLIFL